MRKTIVFVGLLISCLPSAVVLADVRGYDKAVSNLQQGMVVRQGQAERGPLDLEPASIKNGSHVVGITVDPPGDPVVSNEGKPVVFVEAQGEVVALVTGDIARGDSLTLSATPGIMTKLNDKTNGIVMATALEATNPTRAQTLELQTGPTSVNSIKVRFGAGVVTPVDPATTSLRQFGEGIVNEDIRPQKLAMAILLSIATIITSAVIINRAISQGLFAVSRNPLAKRTIIFTTYKILAVAIAIVALGLGGAYYIIK